MSSDLKVNTDTAEVGLDAGRLARVDRRMDRYVDDGKLHGFLLTVARHGKLVHVGRAGLRNVEEGLPVEEDTRWRIFSMTKPVTSVAAMVRYEEPAGTSHMVATDRWGNVASLTSTIESPWGSGVTVDGMFLNNELTDFHVVPAGPNGLPVANRVEGGKRPRSSMSPTIAYGPDGEVRVAVGAAGGPTIIAQVAKVLIGGPPAAPSASRTCPSGP